MQIVVNWWRKITIVKKSRFQSNKIICRIESITDEIYSLSGRN